MEEPALFRCLDARASRSESFCSYQAPRRPRETGIDPFWLLWFTCGFQRLDRKGGGGGSVVVFGLPCVRVR